LERLETSGEKQNITKLAGDLPLFTAQAPQKSAPSGPTIKQELNEILQTLKPDELTPREALETLYRMKALL
jgi:DNA mismatch repair protein MutS